MAGKYLASHGFYILRQITKRIWFRASLFSVAAIVTALVAAWIAPFIPYELSLRVGGKAVDNILTILASSMLAVTTFALSASVTAYGSATSTVTPRATQLLVDDRFTQNALSSFSVRSCSVSSASSHSRPACTARKDASCCSSRRS